MTSTSSPSDTSASLRHAATLPPSAYLLHPSLHPAAKLVLIPRSIYATLSLPASGTHVALGSCVATLQITEHFLQSTATPPIALLTPCLSISRPPLSIAPIAPPSLTEVTISPLFPAADAANAKYFARLGARALNSRDANIGDILPLSRGVFAVVTRVLGKGIVTSDTRVAVTLGVAPRRDIPPAIAAAARARWASRAFWRLRRHVAELDACIAARAAVVVLAGVERDLKEAVRAFAVAQDVRIVRGVEKRGEIERKMKGGGVVVCEGGEAKIAETLMSRFDGGVGFEEGDEEGEEERTAGGRMVVFVCQEMRDLPAVVRGRVEAEVVVDVADEGERRKMLKEIVDDEAHLEELGRMSIGFARAEVAGLGEVYHDGGMSACRKAVELFGKGKLTVDAGGVTWEDIGGLGKAKEQILELVDLDGADGEVNMNRRVGILLYGPPGTGKTLLARAVAGECGCSFISVKGPELLDMYVGESEKHVREVFERATAAAPCVVFFDELDALAPSRGRGSDSGGVADRVVSQLLAEFDVSVVRRDIFIIAASNRPDLVDAGLLRPGRLDRMVYVPMPLSRAEQVAILKAQTRKFKLDGDVDMFQVLDHAPPPPCLSGADLYALAAGAWMHAARTAVEKGGTGVKCEEQGIDMGDDAIENALRAAAQWVDKGHIYKGWSSDRGDASDLLPPKTPSKKWEVSVVVSEEHLIQAARELKPSLSARQLREYEELRIRIETGV